MLIIWQKEQPSLLGVAHVVHLKEREPGLFQSLKITAEKGVGNQCRRRTYYRPESSICIREPLGFDLSL